MQLVSQPGLGGLAVGWQGVLGQATCIPKVSPTSDLFAPLQLYPSPAGRYGVYGQGHPHRYGVYGQEHKHRGYGAYGHHRRLSSFESGAARELQGFASHAHGHKHHGADLGVLSRQHSLGLGAGWLSTRSCC